MFVKEKCPNTYYFKQNHTCLEISVTYTPKLKVLSQNQPHDAVYTVYNLEMYSSNYMFLTTKLSLTETRPFNKMYDFQIYAQVHIHHSKKMSLFNATSAHALKSKNMTYPIFNQ